MPPVRNAPELPAIEARGHSELGAFGTGGEDSFDRWTPPRRWFNQNMPPSVVLLQQCHCRNLHRGKLQNLSPLSVVFELSRIFLQYTGDTGAKNDGPEF